LVRVSAIKTKPEFNRKATQYDIKVPFY